MNTLNTNTIIRRLLIIALAITPMLAFAHGGLEHVHGIIASITDQSVTVTTTAGKTVEVLLDAQTTYAKAEKAIQKSDLKVGDRDSNPRGGEGNYADSAHCRGWDSGFEEALIGRAIHLI